jgi:hypothetical protein
MPGRECLSKKKINDHVFYGYKIKINSQKSFTDENE